MQIRSFLRQLAAVVEISFATIPQRLGAACTTVIGVVGVVAVLLAVLSIAAGFERTVAGSGRRDTAIVLQSGSINEVVSGFSPAEIAVISDVAAAVAGSSPLFSPELYMTVNLPIGGRPILGNAPLRGVQDAAFGIHDLKILAGRKFESGRNEIIAGEAALRAYPDLKLGSRHRWGGTDWTVTGIFGAGGSIDESELWTDARDLQAAFNRGNSFQSVRIRLASPQAVLALQRALLSDSRVHVDVRDELTSHSQQSKSLVTVVQRTGLFLAILMTIGATFGSLNAMYTAVSSRAEEIALLRALGFGAGPALISVLAESLVLASIGWLLGSLLAYLMFDGFAATSATTETFAQVSFRFKVTFGMIAQSGVFALVIGAAGGLLPAFKAARQPIVEGLQISM